MLLSDEAPQLKFYTCLGFHCFAESKEEAFERFLYNDYMFGEFSMEDITECEHTPETESAWVQQAELPIPHDLINQLRFAYQNHNDYDSLPETTPRQADFEN